MFLLLTHLKPTSEYILRCSQTGYFGVYPASSGTAPTTRSDAIGYMGAYGITTSIGTGSASDGWQYTYTVPDPRSAVVELNHQGTVRSCSTQCEGRAADACISLSAFPAWPSARARRSRSAMGAYSPHGEGDLADLP